MRQHQFTAKSTVRCLSSQRSLAGSLMCYLTQLRDIMAFTLANKLGFRSRI